MKKRDVDEPLLATQAPQQVLILTSQCNVYTYRIFVMYTYCICFIYLYISLNTHAA